MHTRTGVLSLIDGQTKLSELNSACQNAFAAATMGTLVDKGVITLSDEQQQKLSTAFIATGSDWRTLTISEFFATLLDLI